MPQDTIRAIAQTSDGYLWLGTDEGLARFDGYEFVVFNKDHGDLPNNSITALSPARDGSLWIGTPDGLVHYSNKRFTTYTTANGLPDNSVSAIVEDHNRVVWLAAGIYLSRFDGSRFTNYTPGRDLMVQAVRAVYEDAQQNLWIAGYGGVGKLVANRYVPAIGAEAMGGNIVTVMLKDRNENLWVAGSKGLLRLSAAGKLKQYDEHDGLPDTFVRSLWEDRDGNLWAGTNGGLGRLENGRFVAPPIDTSHDRDWVRCIFEDREGNLWVGMNSGLNRLRDDIFTIYSRAEGLPSDEPTTVFQDRRGAMWIGFHDRGLVLFDQKNPRIYDRRDGLAGNEVFSIREDRKGGLLVATRDGLSRLRGGRFTSYVPNDPLGRVIVFDALEDRRGRIWLATPNGLLVLEGARSQIVVPGGPLLNNSVVALCEGRDGSLWAGTYGRGLWHIKGDKQKLYTTADGLSSDQIRSLSEDAEGTLWVGTFGGGLNAMQQGRFLQYTSRDGLLSDNISHVEDDGRGSLWLSTTRGVCRVEKRELRDYAQRRIAVLHPVNYGVEDGLRSAQCAPGYPTSSGGFRSSDGRLWFPTSRGLAVLDPASRKPQMLPPLVHVVEMTADGRQIDPASHPKLEPGNGRVQIRYTGIHLSAPERVRYFYKLEGIDREWVPAGGRRTINYNSLSHGRYRFSVRAEIPGSQPTERSYAFEVLPHFYETTGFRIAAGIVLLAGIWAVYQMRLRQIRSRFALVLDERVRLAREIHDTLAQGFVGIASQLDAVALSMNGETGPARQHLELARRMARHSLTEARRSVTDLRDSVLDGQDLPAALETGARHWTAGSSVELRVDVAGELRKLPEETEQHLLRIAQEAVTNALKHSGASEIRIHLGMEARTLRLSVTDNGNGFDQQNAFSAAGGHFGLLGMRERAERMGGELRLASRPCGGTTVEVSVPLT